MSIIKVTIHSYDDGTIAINATGYSQGSVCEAEGNCAREIAHAIAPILHKYAPGGIEFERDLKPNVK